MCGRTDGGSKKSHANGGAAPNVGMVENVKLGQPDRKSGHDSRLVGAAGEAASLSGSSPERPNSPEWATKSTAARKDVQRSERSARLDMPLAADTGSTPVALIQADTQAPPVDMEDYERIPLKEVVTHEQIDAALAKKDARKGDRHRPGYWKDYQRKDRVK